MTVLPSYVQILFDGFGEEFDPSVERTEMERGVPKQRLLNTHVMAEIPVSLLFATQAATAAFEDWYFDVLRRIGWFQMPHPRTGATITARFKDGKIGRLAPRSPRMTCYVRTGVVLEYLR